MGVALYAPYGKSVHRAAASHSGSGRALSDGDAPVMRHVHARAATHALRHGAPALARMTPDA